MRENGTDRDVALQMVSLLTDINTALVNINDHKFVAHILTQPTDQTGSVGDTVTFSVVADNVKAYQWQYKRPDQGGFINTTGLTGYDTDTLTVPITAVRNGWLFRCAVTGLDNNIVYSDSALLTVE